MMWRQIERLERAVAELQHESKNINARIDELVRELTGKTIENKEQSITRKEIQMTTPRQQKKYEKKLRKARDRFLESARELVRLYCEDPESCAGRIDGMMIPGAPGFLCPWTVLLGPSVVMTKRASDAALRLREGAIQQVKDKLGAEKYEELKNEIKKMLGGSAAVSPEEQKGEEQ